MSYLVIECHGKDLKILLLNFPISSDKLVCFDCVNVMLRKFFKRVNGCWFREYEGQRERLL